MIYEMESQPRSSANSMALFCLGAAVGATVMLLCAPASGREVRSQIADKATHLKDKVGEFAGQAADKASEWKEKARHSTHDTLARAAEAFNGASVSTGAGPPGQKVKV